jgi:hypothetical protein
MYELSLALPAISGVQPAYGWHAPWTRSVDDLPFIGPHRNYPHHLFALGLGANLATAFLASRILVRAVAGQPGQVRRLLRLRADCEPALTSGRTKVRPYDRRASRAPVRTEWSAPREAVRPSAPCERSERRP